MTEDEVVQEVRTARDAFASSHGYDIRAMVAALREMAAASGREVVSLVPKAVPTSAQTPQPAVAALPVPGVQSH